MVEGIAKADSAMNQTLAYEFLEVVPTVVATGLCNSLCTVQLPDGQLTGAGQPSGTFVNVSGLVNLTVMSAPMSEARIQATEMKELEDIQSFAPQQVWVAGFYPQVEGLAEKGAQVLLNGTAYDLMGAECDSQFQMTLLAIRNSGL